MVAFQWAKAEVCPNCGTRHDEWVDEDGREKYPPPYVVDGLMCWGCAELDLAGKSDDRLKRPGARPILRKWTPKDEPEEEAEIAEGEIVS